MIWILLVMSWAITLYCLSRLASVKRRWRADIDHCCRIVDAVAAQVGGLSELGAMLADSGISLQHHERDGSLSVPENVGSHLPTMMINRVP